jgi:hypothetical protein
MIPTIRSGQKMKRLTMMRIIPTMTYHIGVDIADGARGAA